jgi:hypothetical protein
MNYEDSPSTIATPTKLTPEEIAAQKKHSYLMWLLSGVVGMIFLILVALVVIAANLVVSSSKNPVKVEVPAIIEPLPPTISRPISKFASDAGVLSLADSLTKLRSEIDSVDLFETQLAPPSIDLNIRVTIQQ